MADSVKTEEESRVRLVAGSDPSKINTSENKTNDTVSRATSLESENSSNDLLGIVTDPNAQEHEWLQACNELEKQKQTVNSSKAVPRKRRGLKWALLAASCASAVVGAAALFHWGPFAPPNVDFGPYLANLQQEIKSHWHPPASSGSNKIRIHFKIKKNGEVSDVGFDRMARVTDADAAALNALIETMPSVDPLPANSPEFVDVSFSFDYNVKKSPKESKSKKDQ